MNYTIIPLHYVLNFQHELETEFEIYTLDVVVNFTHAEKENDLDEELELVSADCKGRDFLEFLTDEQKGAIFYAADSHLSMIEDEEEIYC